MIGLIALLREDQNKDLASLNPLHDCFGPIGPRFDVPRGDPALDAVRFESLANLLRDGFVLAGMADKDLRRHQLLLSVESINRSGRRWLQEKWTNVSDLSRRDDRTQPGVLTPDTCTLRARPERAADHLFQISL